MRLFDVANSKNDKVALEKMKIAFQFLLMVLCSSIIGGIVSKSLSRDFYLASPGMISKHFDGIFLNCYDFLDFASYILNYAAIDIISFLVIFAVSFAVFNYVATDFVLLFGGFNFGLSVIFLSEFANSAELGYSIGYLRYFIFVFFKLLVLVFLFDYSFKAAKISITLKKTGPIGRPRVKLKVLFPFIVQTLTYLGAVIIINGLYCFFIFIFSK